MVLPKVGWALLYQLTMQKIPQDIPTDQADKENRLTEPLQVLLGCFKVTVNAN